MAEINIISINPCVATKASLNQDFFERLAREEQIRMHYGKKAQSRLCEIKGRINFLLGINNGTPHRLSGKIAMLRIMSALAIIAVMLIDLHQGIEVSVPMQIISIALAASLILGLCTRVVSAASLLGIAAVAITSGAHIFYTPFSAIILIALTFALIGPGTISLDNLIRYRTFVEVKRRIRRKAERRLSYRAFAEA